MKIQNWSKNTEKVIQSYARGLLNVILQVVVELTKNYKLNFKLTIFVLKCHNIKAKYTNESC